MMKKDYVRKVYLYIFTIVGLVLIVSGAVGILNLGLKAWIFTEADNERYYEPPRLVDENGTMTELSAELSEERRADYARSQNQQDAARNIAMLLVGLPLYLFHWNRIRKETVKK